MGTDIHGWIEVKSPVTEDWLAIVQVWSLINRTYDMFGSLFGVKNRLHFRPVAANRGVPTDVPREAQQEIARGVGYPDIFGHTWITWAEIKAIDWSERAQEGSPVSQLHDAQSESTPPTRADVLQQDTGDHEDWKLVFQLMETLASRFGDTDVRLVVYFDC